MFNLMNFAKEI